MVRLRCWLDDERGAARNRMSLSSIGCGGLVMDCSSNVGYGGLAEIDLIPTFLSCFLFGFKGR